MNDCGLSAAQAAYDREDDDEPEDFDAADDADYDEADRREDDE
jgi:hypothetical protein